MTHDPNWTAPRDGLNWRDERILRATSWLRSFVPSREMEGRLEKARETIDFMIAEQLAGRRARPFDKSDAAAWTVFQGETYAVDRRYWIPSEAALIAPILTRIGVDLEVLRAIPGADERAARMMNEGRAQPEGALYELLVAMAYRRYGWANVEFIPEVRGGPRTHDLVASRTRRPWAIECKRMGVSQYAKREKLKGEEMARRVHDLALEAGRSICVDVIFREELSKLPDDYLLPAVTDFLNGQEPIIWYRDEAVIQVRNVDWKLARSVLKKDYVYFGASRMIELIVGAYDHEADHSMSAKWRPSPKNPLYADAVYQASVVSWKNLSKDALSKKGRHFRSIVADANEQLPRDMPGVIHVGIESRDGRIVEAGRQFSNWLEMIDFDPKASRLRWIYANVLAPEETTRKDESWAINESTVPYKVGRHHTQQPMFAHLLLTEPNEGRPGVHWDGL